MKKIRSKGYTLEVVSWENDADNYQTHLVTVDSEDKALALKEMCDELFNSYHSCDKGISNDCKEELEDKDEKIILINKLSVSVLRHYPNSEIIENDRKLNFKLKIHFTLVSFGFLL